MHSADDAPAPGARPARAPRRPLPPLELHLAVLLRDTRCQLCGVQLTLHDLSLPTHGQAGHILSHLDGGLPTPDNLRAECHACGARGGAALQREALARRRAELEQHQGLRGIG